MARGVGAGCVDMQATSGNRSRPDRKAEAGECVTLAFPSDLGWMAAVWHADRLYRFAFGYGGRAAVLTAVEQKSAIGPDSWRKWASFIARLRAVAEGGDDDLRDLEVDLDDRTSFQRAVLRKCRQIPRGCVRTYADLARAAGHPGSARAVGNVMATNRLPLIIPCHRVVGSGGKLGGFSAPQGLEMKRRLLEMEGAGAPQNWRMAHR
jgi:methylated-DNA-[protein]-cysteine S-methyltransferase